MKRLVHRLFVDVSAMLNANWLQQTRRNKETSAVKPALPCQLLQTYGGYLVGVLRCHADLEFSLDFHLHDTFWSCFLFDMLRVIFAALHRHLHQLSTIEKLLTIHNWSMLPNDNVSTDIETLSLGNILQLCGVRSFSIIDCTNWMNLFSTIYTIWFARNVRRDDISTGTFNHANSLTSHTILRRLVTICFSMPLYKYP